MNAPELVTIIVSTYNRPDALACTLAGCLAQTDRRLEIIVADDGSGPATQAVIEQATLEAAHAGIALVHVWQPDNGFRLAAIRNRAIVRARGDYLIFLDGDCVPQRDFVAQHLSLAAAGSMVTGSRVLLERKLTQSVLEGGTPLGAASAAFLIGQRVSGQINKTLPLLVKLPDCSLRRVNSFRWRGIKGCNLAAWRRDVEHINGFDETFTGWGHEDADFVARLSNAGIVRKKGFCATEVFHLWHAEQPRGHAGPNRERVIARLAAGAIRAERGLAENAAND
jgi:glycosyltransferase involved in cell wall biosynthesis